jgi:uncharacterized protein YxjI
MFNYPLTLSFKIIAFNPQVRVTDSSGALVLYVKQRALAFKEDVKIFADEAQTNQLYQLKADRIIDWSAKYNITSPSGQAVGQLRRKGARSILKATYIIADSSGNEVGMIHEENGWIKVADALFSDLPLVGIFAGYIFNPAYFVDYKGKTVLYLKKQPAFLEGKFTVEKRGDFGEADENLLLSSVIMSMMLERGRG